MSRSKMIKAWCLVKKNGGFVSNKKIDPTNPISIALFKTKRHAKVFLDDNPMISASPLCVTVDIWRS